MPPFDQQARATENLTKEIAKLGRLLEMININIVAVAKALDNNAPTVTNKPVPTSGYLNPTRDN